MNNEEKLEQVKKDLPETMRKGLIRKIKNSNREDFDLAEAMEDIINNQFEFIDRFINNERFREKFTEIMFEQYLEDNNISKEV